MSCTSFDCRDCGFHEHNAPIRQGSCPRCGSQNVVVDWDPDEANSEEP